MRIFLEYFSYSRIFLCIADFEEASYHKSHNHKETNSANEMNELRGGLLPSHILSETCRGPSKAMPGLPKHRNCEIINVCCFRSVSDNLIHSSGKLIQKCFVFLIILVLGSFTQLSSFFITTLKTLQTG